MSDDDVMMACSVTSSSSRATSTSIVDGAALPTISLDAVADDDRRDADSGDDDDGRPSVVVDNLVDAVAEAKRASRAGHDRKKHASYR